MTQQELNDYINEYYEGNLRMQRGELMNWQKILYQHENGFIRLAYAMPIDRSKLKIWMYTYAEGILFINGEEFPMSLEEAEKIVIQQCQYHELELLETYRKKENANQERTP